MEKSKIIKCICGGAKTVRKYVNFTRRSNNNDGEWVNVPCYQCN